MSKRAAIREKRRRARRQRQLAVGVVIIGLSVIVAAYMIWQQNKPLGEFVQITVTPHGELAQGKSLGDPDAPVLIELFEDFQCPACGQFTSTVEPLLVEQYVNTGKVRLAYHHYTVVDQITGGRESRRAAEASECAAQQDKFWELHDVLFANQKGEGIGTFSDRRLVEMAVMAGLDRGTFVSCFEGGQGTPGLNEDLAAATRLGIRSTPTIFVSGTRVQNPMNFAEFQQLIDPLIESQ